MSKVIDQRVVEMQFDNRHFERNVATSMSTLDKLKQKLNIGGAAKSLEGIDTAARKVNLNGLGSAVESVSAKFSALQVMGVTALANITNSAVNAGKRIVSALTIDPIRTGFQEYETQINAVQTILANTSSKGTTIDDVNVALEELNRYADMTIYNFTEMTRNIGTFTAAGVDLDTSVNAIKGIANLAAVSGSTSQQASTAMYQLSQALASGTVKLMDWNSVVNAGMGGEVFQNALKDTARIHGVAIDQMIEDEGSFRETLSQGWLTSEILTETLEKFTLSAQEGTEEWEKLKQSLKEKGYTDEQAAEILKMGNTATDAATKVKTFTQLWDVMKEAAQSGWAQTWKLLIGDFEEAKTLLTPISEMFTSIINKMSEARNDLLESALGKGFTSLLDGLGFVKNSVATVLEPINTAAAALEDLGDIADKVILGSFGNGADRIKALSDAGYNFYKVQNKVNETLGNSFRYSEEQIAAQDKALQIQSEIGDQTENQAEATIKLTEANKNQLKSLIKMNDAQLRANGYTEKQINALRELEAQAEKIGLPIDEFIDKIDEINGRWLLIESFKNIGRGVVDVFKAMKEAWQDIFPPKSMEDRAQSLFDLIAGFHKLTTSMVDVIYKDGELTDTGEKLVRTFKGLFAVIDIIATITGGAFKFAFELAKEVLSYFNLDILDVTASIGDALVSFRDFIDGILDIEGAVDKVAPYIEKAIEAIQKWVDGFKTADNIPKYIIEGLVKGLTSGVSAVWDGMVALAEGIWDAFCDFFGINSPSTLMIAAGGFIIAGLVVGLQNGFSDLLDVGAGIGSTLFEAISTALEKLVVFLKDVDLGAVLAAGLGIAGLVIAKKFVDALQAIASPLEGIGDMFEGLGDMFEGIGANFKASAWEKRGKAILNMALAIGILAAAVALLARIEPGPLWTAVGAIAALIVFVGALAAVVGKFGPKDTINMIGFGVALLGMGGAMLMIAGAVKKLAALDEGELLKAGVAVAALGGIIVGLIAATKLFGGGAKIGSALMGMALAMMLLIVVIKLVSGMDANDLLKGLAVTVALGAIITGLLAATKLFNSGKIGGTLMAMGTTMLLLVVVIKLVAGINDDDLERGLLTIIAFGGIITALLAATKLFNSNASNIGSTLLAMSTSMLLLTIVVKLIAGMDEQEILKGVACITAFGLVMVALVAATKLAGGGNLAGVPTTLLAMSVAIGILAGVAALLGMIKLENLAKGVVAVGLLSAMMALLVASTKNAKDVKGTIVTLIVAVGLLAVAIAALSLIDASKLAASTASLTTVMLAFSALTAATKLSKNTKQMRSSLLIMLGVVVVLAAVVAALSLIDSENALPNTIALSILMTAFAGALAIMGSAGRISTTVSKQIVPMLAVVAGLAVILGVMAALEVEASIQTAIALSILLTAMSGALAILSLAGPNAKGGVGALALMGLVVAELAVILGVMAALDVEPSIETAAALSLLLVAMSGALVLLSAVGATGPAAFIGIGALATLIAGIGGLVVAIGALVTEFPVLEEFLNTGIPIIEKIGYAIGSFFGNIVGGFVGNLASGLPDIGTDLSSFMENLKPFIEGANGIDEGTMTGVKTIAETILILTAANILDTVASWLNSGTSLSDFGKQLLPFGEAMVDFSNAVSGNIDQEAVEAAANAGKLMAEMAAMLPNTGGVVGWFMGENDMDIFADKLVPFGRAMVEFSGIVAGNIDEGAVTAAANAGKVMAEMADTIPNTGGLVSWFTGDNDIGTFGQKLVSFGRAMLSFSSIVSGNISEESVTAAANAGKVMAEMAATIPNTGGVVSWFTGDNDMETFGVQLVAFGKAMKKFSKEVSGNIDSAAITAAANAGTTVAELAATLPDSGGIGSWFKGDNTMDKFGEQLVAFGVAIKEYSKEVSGISTAAMAAATTELGVLIEMAKGMEGISFDSLGKFGKNLGEIGKDGVEKFIKAFADSNDEVESEGKALLEALLTGIEKNSKSMESTFGNLASKCSTVVRGKYQAFYNAGAYLAEGLANGVASKAQRVANQAAAMVNSAVAAAKAAAGIASPSKVFYRLGEYTGMGFVNALVDYCSKTYNAAYEMADAARSGLSDTIGRIANVLDRDMDIQPTIRPVLDMSDIRTGVGTISSMFNTNPTVGVLANVGAISTQMNRNGQNGVNGDVVSAINKLRGDLGNLGATQYNINGITYDDGSNISDAVRTIVRAARIERRV